MAAASCLFILPAHGQQIYFGAVAGTNLTDNFLKFQQSGPADEFGNPAYFFAHFSGPPSLILGALVEGQISNRFSLEANILRRPMNGVIQFTQFPVGAPPNASRLNFTAVTAWEFPLMLKYTWRPGWTQARPFLEAGPSWRSEQLAEAVQPSQFGWMVGAGLAWQLERFRVAPTVRYTRWDADNSPPKYPLKQDQVEFLTSFAYRTESESRRIGAWKMKIGAMAGYGLTRNYGPEFGETIPEKARYLVGASAQMDVAGGFSVEVDGIYKPLRTGRTVTTQFSVITWDFPLMGKYAWTKGRWTPFAEAGPSFRAAGNLNGYNPSHYGVTLGGGVERRMGGFVLSPTARYTRWATDASPYHLPAGVPYPKTNANALELLLGLAF